MVREYLSAYRLLLGRIELNKERTMKNKKSKKNTTQTNLRVITLDNLKDVNGGACSHSACSHAGGQAGLQAPTRQKFGF